MAWMMMGMLTDAVDLEKQFDMRRRSQCFIAPIERGGGAQRIEQRYPQLAKPVEFIGLLSS